MRKSLNKHTYVHLLHFTSQYTNGLRGQLEYHHRVLHMDIPVWYSAMRSSSLLTRNSIIYS